MLKNLIAWICRIEPHSHDPRDLGFGTTKQGDIFLQCLQCDYRSSGINIYEPMDKISEKHNSNQFKIN